MERILVYGMTDNFGGIETYLMNQLRSLDRSRAIFDFVTDFPAIAYESEARELGSEIYYIPAKSRGILAQWKAFSKILKEHPEYQKVYFNILDAGAAITMFIPWLYGRTIVTHSHNGNTDKPRLHRLCRPFLNFFTKKRYACSLIASEFMFGRHHSSLIIPNAINGSLYEFNPQLRAEKRRELGLEDRFVICHVGRLSPQKNPKMLIDIFAELSQKDPQAVLLSIGSGEQNDTVHAYAAKKNLGDALRFLGKRTDVHEILQAADVFLLPSLYEGLPLVAIEAQAAGLPCILSGNISQEAAITDHVRFLSLDLPLSEWVKEIVSLKGFKRRSMREALIQAGYDCDHPSEAELSLRQYFENNIQ